MKQKLRITVLLLSFITGGLLISSLFSLLAPVPVFAVDRDEYRIKVCERMEIAEVLCSNAFYGGYNDRVNGVPDTPNPCEKKHPPRAPDVYTDEYNACAEGYNFRMKEEDEAKEAQRRADRPCMNQGYSGDLLDICRKAYGEGATGKSKSRTCPAEDYNPGSEEAEACEIGHTIGSGGTPPRRPKPDCDSKWNSYLSWIACPLIDIGVSATDTIFQKFLVPMLETVPVSTKTNHGSYLAWQQFRIIANILLVGTLLMVVYSQAKGGDS